MIKKLSINENSGNRINDSNVSLGMSRNYGDLQNAYTTVSDRRKDSLRQLNYTIMNLDEAYARGIIGRTVINGFNEHLNDVITKLYDFQRALDSLIGYDIQHIPSDSFQEIDSDNDWFRNHAD